MEMLISEIKAACETRKIQNIQRLLDTIETTSGLTSEIGWHCLQFSINVNDPKVVAWLLDFEWVDVNSTVEFVKGDNKTDMGTAIHLAVGRGYLEISSVLVAHPKTDVNVPNCNGRTPLEVASRNGYESVVSLLLSHPKTDVNRGFPYTPLAQAVLDGHTGVARMLLSRKDVNPNARVQSGTTALVDAITRGRNEIVQLLLAHEAIDVNAIDDYRRTALGYAVIHKNVDAVKMILEKEGVVVAAHDCDDLTPVDHAKKLGFSEIESLLELHA